MAKAIVPNTSTTHKRFDEAVSGSDPLDRPKRPTTYFSGLSGSGVRGSFDPRKFAPRLPTPFGETVGTALDVAMDEQSLAIKSALFEQYDTYIKEVEEAIGPTDLVNPYNAGPELQDQMMKRFRSRVTELAQSNPSMPIRTHEGFLAAVEERRQAVRERREQAASGETGVASGVGAFIGGTAGALSDPVVLPTLFLGAPWSSGVLRFALTEAAIGAGSTAVAQGAFQLSRQQVGEEPSFREALETTAFAGAGAGIFGGLLRGGAKGIGAFRRSLDDRRTRLQMAESLAAAQKTPDVDAAIAVERRTLDIEEANPLGRDLEGQSVHGQRYAAAEKALAEGRILPKNASIDGATFFHLSEADRQVMQEFGRIANETPEQFGVWIDALKNLPENAVREAETFAQFVQRQGRLFYDLEEAVKLDMATVRSIDDVLDLLPVTNSSKGKTFDEIAAMAKAEGFFAETPTPRQIVDALREEVLNGRPLQRASVDVGVPVSLGRQVGVLDRLGIPFRDLEPQQVAARLRAISGAEEADRAPQRQLRDIGAAEQANRAAARADNERVTTETESKASSDLDEAREQLVRELYNEKPDTVLIFENADGTIERMTVAEMFERNRLEADELEALSLCLTRGRG